MKPDLSETEIRTIQGRHPAQVCPGGQPAPALLSGTPPARTACCSRATRKRLREIPDSVLHAFCGVGNPFSLGASIPEKRCWTSAAAPGWTPWWPLSWWVPAGRVVGVDATPEMIARARANLALTGLTNVSFEVAPAEALPFPDREFDVVISNGVFNLTVDKEQALRRGPPGPQARRPPDARRHGPGTGAAGS